VTLTIPRWLRAVLESAVLVAAVTAVIALLEPRVPALGLGVLYVLAVVPIALAYGGAVAAAVSLASLAVFSFFFIPPQYSLDPGTSERWGVLAAFLFSSLVVSQLASRARREVRRSARLADEQAALRRVATLVATGVPPPEVFAAVARELALLLEVDASHMGRYELDGTATVVGAWSRGGEQVPIGTRVELDGESVAGLVFRTGRPARIQDYEHASGPTAALSRKLGMRSSVGAPIVVDQHLWGVMNASTKQDRPLPADVESRIAAFTELVATAIFNTEARAQMGRLADEQAALRRVATLVARESPAAEVFAAVADEVLQVLDVEITRLYRYETDGTATLVADAADEAARFGVGTRVAIEGRNVSALVRNTGRPARIDDHADATGPLGVRARELGVRCAVGAPIVVGDRLWGALIVGSRQPEPLPASTESRLAEFTALVATSISNVQARAELAASRARVVAAADTERRRVVRDLHDGAQQYLVHAIITLKLAHDALPAQGEPGSELVAEALERAERANVELRELARGILPSALTKGGLRAGVDQLASRTPVPVEIDVPVGRLPAAVEATAYFVVAEALTNVAKHAQAGHAEVTARIDDGTLAVQVRDDGVGGARPDGSGLTGLADRLAALDGELRVESPADGGTLLAAAIPLPS
jgi:signal transduction histidine kinase